MTAFSLPIQVTEPHIHIGERSNCFTCPVAIAINDALQQGGYRFYSADVGLGIAYLTDHLGTYVYRAETPDSVNAFIYDFDTYGRANPFECVLEFSEYAVGPGRSV